MGTMITQAENKGDVLRCILGKTTEEKTAISIAIKVVLDFLELPQSCPTPYPADSWERDETDG